jgi:hypothetical protein
MGKQQRPSLEELEYVYGLLAQGLPWTEVREEMGETEFPLRTDKRYYAQRIREFNATKSVLGNRTHSSQDTIAAEAQQAHFEDLLTVTKRWQECLVFDVGDSIYVRESKVPSSFSKADGEVGAHTAGPLVWLVGHDGQVEVWMAVERRHRLFGALLEHLSHDVAATYQSIKDKIRDAITEMTESQAARISLTSLPSLVSELAEKLDVVLDSRMFGGNCEVCRRIAGEDVL